MWTIWITEKRTFFSSWIFKPYLFHGVSWKVVFRKPFSKLYCICLPFEKLANKKHFPIKEKIGLVFSKVLSFYFRRKILSRSCEKFRNVLLFVYYIKFDPQSFNCYIFCFESFFFLQYHPLEFHLIWLLYQLWFSFFWLLFAFLLSFS
jgi:hypothetical protein